MARKNRSKEIIESEIGLYHITDRCVRRAFLMGRSGKRSFDARREWLHERLIHLASCFLIDIVSFCILGNHMHLILRNRPDLVKQMTDEEVIHAWWKISPRYRRNGEPGRLTQKRLNKLLRDRDHIRMCRERLSSISWFMRYLKLPLAVSANLADDRSGHFWEARFRCEPLDTLRKLLNSMIYVDLNWVRAGLATSISHSQQTSAAERLKAIKQRRSLRKKTTRHAQQESKKLAEQEMMREIADSWLSPIPIDQRDPTLTRVRATPTHISSLPKGPQVTPRKRASDHGVLPISTEKYLMLVDLMGRRQKTGKRGKIPPDLPPILNELGFETPAEWLREYDDYVQDQEATYRAKVNTDAESKLVTLPLVDKTKTNQDALM